MHADLLRHPDAGLHLPLLRVGAGPGPGHGTVAMPVRGRGRLPPPGMGLPPLAKPFPVRPPGMALAHRHHGPHAATQKAAKRTINPSSLTKGMMKVA